jgi:hypothetical protein
MIPTLPTSRSGCDTGDDSTDFESRAVGFSDTLMFAIVVEMRRPLHDTDTDRYMYTSIYPIISCVPLPLIFIADITYKIAYRDVEIHSSLSWTLVNPRPIALSNDTVPAASIRLRAVSMITRGISVGNGS